MLWTPINKTSQSTYTYSAMGKDCWCGSVRPAGRRSYTPRSNANRMLRPPPLMPRLASGRPPYRNRIVVVYAVHNMGSRDSMLNPQILKPFHQPDRGFQVWTPIVDTGEKMVVHIPPEP